MHSFSLVMGSLLGHPTASEIVKQAQRVVSYFQASHKPHGLLMQAADRLGIKQKALQSSNQTRFSSVHMMLQSVLTMERAFQTVMAEAPHEINASDVQSILSARLFWARCEQLCQLLKPYSDVITAIQRSNANLADVTRYWLYLARTLRQQLEDFDYGAHCSVR